MKTKKIIKRTLGIIALTLAVLLIAGGLLIGRFIYVTRYQIGDIDSSAFRDYEVLFQSVGEPDFPFGDAYARLVLKHNGKTVTKYKLDVANDGGILSPANWRVNWTENAVEVTVSGEEQSDALYTLYFDGRTECREDGE